MSGGYFRCWLQACGAVDRFVVVFFISPSKMGLWWFTLAALLLIIFLIDAAKKEDFFFSLLVLTVWHQQTRKRTLTVCNHRMETLLLLTVFVDSECSNLTFLMTPTPSCFFSLLKFCKTYLLFLGIFKTFQKQKGNSQHLTGAHIIKDLSGNMTI